ncbi:MAG: hypothetical protein ACLPYB_00905 [Desulfobaccales bacterium]
MDKEHREISIQDYRKAFTINKICEDKKVIDALKCALDLRKFEIDMYWKRATYFWAFIAATFAGYGAIQASSISNKDELSLLLSCLGFIFSFGWILVNKGSKHWQRNWEKHVSLLSDYIVGPLFEIVWEDNPETPKNLIKRLKEIVSGPSLFSVSKINQIISIYVTLFWSFLIYKSLHIGSSNIIDGEKLIIIIIIILFIYILYRAGRSEIYRTFSTRDELPSNNLNQE